MLIQRCENAVLLLFYIYPKCYASSVLCEWMPSWKKRIGYQSVCGSSTLFFVLFYWLGSWMCSTFFSFLFSFFLFWKWTKNEMYNREKNANTLVFVFHFIRILLANIFQFAVLVVFVAACVCLVLFLFYQGFFFISFVVRTIRNSENQTLIFETVETKKNIYKITNKIQKKNSSKQQQYKPVNVLQWHYYHIQWKSIIHLVSAFLNNYIYCGVRSTTNQMHK